MRLCVSVGASLLAVAGERPDADIHLYLNAGPQISTFDLFRAKALTSRMLAAASVRLHWDRAAAAHPCGPVSGIVVDLATNIGLDDHPGALAYARPYEGAHIVVALDRLESSAGEKRMIPILLAHVMSHEIGHLLEGFSRHSPAGIMKAHWDAIDVLQMLAGPLEFTSDDIDLINRGIQRGRMTHRCTPPMAGITWSEEH
jgi:hypothetical protein